ncbi:unnamed protein product [Cuscuta europaea]|uniref:Uncharacterized protein n=1 Tax=Cuscuta europaea TaxID=41803 RepID=A0A9P1ENB9_CUSEU|nr:unnamed protein product [Cuscuta europaea]
MEALSWLKDQIWNRGCGVRFINGHIENLQRSYSNWTNGGSSVTLDSLTWVELGDVADGGPTLVAVLDANSREDNDEGADKEALNDLSRSFFLDFFSLFFGVFSK